MIARILLAAMLVAIVAWGVLAAGCKPEPQPAATGKAPAAAVAKTEIAQKLCPVTGDPIDPKVYLDHNERRGYFCCSACETTFKKDPDKYLKIVDDQIKAAATK